MIQKSAQKFGTQSSASTARRQQAENIWSLQKDTSYFRCVHDTSHEDFKRWYESWHKIDGTLLSIVWEEVWEWGPEDTKSGKDNGLWRVSGANSVAASPLPTMGWEIQILFKKSVILLVSMAPIFSTFRYQDEVWEWGPENRHGIWAMHSYFFLHIERSFWCFADLVTIFERFREYSKIVPLMVSQSSLLFSWLNFCRLAHTSTTEKSLENAAFLLQ